MFRNLKLFLAADIAIRQNSYFYKNDVASVVTNNEFMLNCFVKSLAQVRFMKILTHMYLTLKK